MINLNTKTTVIYGNTTPTLEELQELVGGYIEVVHEVPRFETGKAQLIVDEEGRIKGLPMNPLASYYAGKTIVGNAVILVNNTMMKD